MMIERSENNNISRLDRSELRPVNLGRCQPILERARFTLSFAQTVLFPVFSILIFVSLSAQVLGLT